MEIIPNCVESDADKYTKQYMKKYGIDNVRGGSYLDIVIESTVHSFIQQDITALSADTCYKCGLGGHIASQCTLINLDSIELEAKELSAIHKILEKIAHLKATDSYLLVSYSKIFKAYVKHHSSGIEPNEKQLDDLKQKQQKGDDMEIQINMVDLSQSIEGFYKTIESLNQLADDIINNGVEIDLLKIDSLLTILFKYLRFIYKNDTYVDSFKSYFT